MNRLNGKLYLVFGFSLAGTSVISARFVTGKLGTFTITAISLFFALAFLVPLCGKQLIRYIQLMSFRNFIFLSLQALFWYFSVSYVFIKRSSLYQRWRSGHTHRRDACNNGAFSYCCIKGVSQWQKTCRNTLYGRRYPNHPRSIKSGERFIL